MLQEVRHRFIDKLVGNCLLGLVFIGSLCGKTRGNQNQTVLYIRKGDFGFILQVFSVAFQPAIQLGYKCLLHRTFRRAAMFQKTGVVVVFDLLYPIGKRERNRKLYLISRLVLPVFSLSLTVPILNGGQRCITSQFLYIVRDTIFIQIL